MKLKKIEIESFRHLTALKFDFGKNLTVIAGSNGTGKTSLLGLIGHVFKYDSNFKTINNKYYETKFSEVFKFSPAKENTNEYNYKIEFEGDIIKTAKSRCVTENGRLRFRIDVGGRVRYGGKIKYPVIYLSLKRLIPLAGENTIKLGGADELGDEEKKLYKNYYNMIFAQNIDIIPLHTVSFNKQSYLPTNATYDSHGVSAGQDNVGQIILSLLEFRRLKATNIDYSGGLILIDEIDATLYPASQKNLINLINTVAKELDLQVVFTTHSSDILNYLSSRKAAHFKHTTHFVSLSNALGRVEVKEGMKELQNVLADLNHEAVRTIKPKKINVYLEDKEACLFFKNILKGVEFECELDFKELSLSCGTYKTLLEKGFEEFYKSIVVIDGDFRNGIAERFTSNVIFLPGNDRPENLIKKFLESLDESDPFWNNTAQYTKRVFIQSLNGVNDTREDMKRWFNNQLVYWGEDGTIFFDKWKINNSSEATIIIDKTKKLVSHILDNLYDLLNR